ncbi:Protease production enhancer protein [Salinivirga cyanobacteriivorans]|uniref:Protease production enhancer protein n=1 Tax=Salinivirga cyanobacteriivorans TaxID=1307839 RepID=A0A0S2I2E6_9BACT|nr:response regulator transcription factor [Salinivirga cyanobacteriivorans]ALO16431.1 Protease production enhancer protein [Salinivirga cyanobacteriivorans]
MENLSIILVDDHKLFREGLKSLMENFTYIGQVQEASNGREFLQLLDDSTPDVVFMDIEMPEMDGITATRKAIDAFPDLNVVALSMYGNENYYTQMINAGAKGFILKNSGIQDVENAIQNVMSSNNYFSHEIFQRLIQGLGRKQQKTTNPELSAREEEIVFLICKGLSNQEIADKLYLSKRTVDKHRENILSKTHSKNTAGIVMYAVKNGIVEV